MAVKMDITEVGRVVAEPEYVLVHAVDELRGPVEIKIPTGEFWTLYKSVVPVFPENCRSDTPLREMSSHPYMS